MSNQVVEKELRLVAVIQEARDLLGEVVRANDALAKTLKELPKSAKAEKVEAMRLMELLAAKAKELRGEIHEAQQLAAHIQSHYKWKGAIRALWGQEGVNACITWMDNERETREADASEQRLSIC